jgi:hypothetical protein
MSFNVFLAIVPFMVVVMILTLCDDMPQHFGAHATSIFVVTELIHMDAEVVGWKEVVWNLASNVQEVGEGDGTFCKP